MGCFTFGLKKFWPMYFWARDIWDKDILAKGILAKDIFARDISTKVIFQLKWYFGQVYITISTFMSVRPSGVGVGGVGVGVPLSIFKFLLSYQKVSLIKVAWYVLKVKNMHSWAPPDPWGPWDEEKPSYIHYNIRREEAKQRILKLASVFHHIPSVGPKQLCVLAHLRCTRKAGTS